MIKPEYENPEWKIYPWGLESKKHDGTGHRTLIDQDLNQKTFNEIYEDDFYDNLCWCDAFDRATAAYGERLKGVDGLFAKTKQELDRENK